MTGDADAVVARRARPPAWVLVSAALSLLVVINMSFALRDDPLRELSSTSYGRSPAGFGAVHDLLSELESEPRSERSLAPYSQVPPQRTLWLLAPDLLGWQSPEQGPLRGPDPELAGALHAWIARGGTALVFGDPTSDWSQLEPGLALAPADEAKSHVALSSELGPPLRAIEVPGLRAFDPWSLDGFERVLGKPELPFAVQKRIGKGRLVAIADARPLRNELLDTADHANLAVDLARAFGPPLFDERCHGYVASNSLFDALGLQRSWLLGLGLGLCVLLAVWHLRSVPASTSSRVPGLDPGLTSFVDSLAVLYGRKAPRDCAAVYRAYVHGVRFRLRQQLYGARGGSEEQLGQRLERELAREPALLTSVQGRAEARSERELEQRVRELERCAAVLAERHAARH